MKSILDVLMVCIVFKKWSFGHIFPLSVLNAAEILNAATKLELADTCSCDMYMARKFKD